MAVGDESLFQAEPYIAKDEPDLLDALRDLEGNNDMPSADASHEERRSWASENEWIDAWRTVAESVLPSDAQATQAELFAAGARWHELGFTPDEAVEWTQSIGIYREWRRGADLADDWRVRGFTPQEARNWVQGDVPPGDDAEHSQVFRDAGWHFFEVWSLYCLVDRGSEAWTRRRLWASVPTLHALNCARAGLTPSEAESAQSMGKQELGTHLAERFAERGRIDPFIATLFNHHQWQANGWEDDDSDWHFYARRLWDRHDEADNEAQRKRQRPPYGGPRTTKPAWKVQEERDEGDRLRLQRPDRQRCSNSGGRGELEFRDGMEEWFVHCPECGVKWMGGNGDPLSEHNRPVGR